MKLHKFVAAAALLFATVGPASAQVVLGSYTFDASKFGNTVAASGGAGSGTWLNVVNANPGLTGALTGANFDTGIANIGLSGPTSYTIGYTGGILNGAGDDIGIVTARFSSDPITIAFSADGLTFGSSFVLSSALAVATGVSKNYFFNGGGPANANLFVTSLDFSSFGIASGTSIQSIRVTGTTELDLIRVAGFGIGNAVPEPATWLMMIAGFGIVGAAMRRRKPAVRFA